MKKIYSSIIMLAALLTAGAAMTACGNEDKIIDETQQPAAARTYHMTVDATKGSDEAMTRALYFDGTALKVKWAATDQVSVFPEAWSRSPLGTLTAAASESRSTSLTGSVTTTSLNNGDKVQMLFPRATWDYTGQKGVLLAADDAVNAIEKKYDYALATPSITVSGSNEISATANFTNQQAIVKFILQDQNGNPINATNLTVSAASNKLATAKGYNTKSTTHSGYTATGGNYNTGYSSLVDGNTSTKWSASSTYNWFIDFNTASAVQVDGYTLTTGDDNLDSRNPKNWELMGRMNPSDSWTTIARVTNDTKLPNVSTTSVDFTVDNPGTYQYFSFKISDVHSGSIMELSELQLWETSFGTAYGPLTVTTASPTSEITVALRNENASADTYTLTTTDNNYDYSFEKSGVTFTNGNYYEITVKMTKRAPALGDIYYSDGTYSATLRAGKTPIGIIVYLDQPGTDDDEITEKSNGGGHGLVMALKNAANNGNTYWGSNTNELAYDGSALYRVLELSDLTRSTNVGGYGLTTYLAAKPAANADYPAAYHAKNYSATVPASGTTGWFLPSAQQWVKAITGLGAVSESSLALGAWFDTNHEGADRWEAALSKVGAGNYDSMTSTNLAYWSSSEGSYVMYTTKVQAVSVRVNATDDKGFNVSNNDSKDNQTGHRVRPFLAF